MAHDRCRPRDLAHGPRGRRHLDRRDRSGLALCLLNLNPDPPIGLRAGLRSRGLVIPHLLELGSIADAADELARTNLRPFAPFRLIGAGSGPAVLEARWDRTRLSMSWHADLPLCLVSSGLGDALVAPRLDLFEELVVEPGPSPARQDDFHRHSWPDRRELSVLMTRADARTVSITTLEIRPRQAGPRVEMFYAPIPDAARTPAAALTRGVRA